MSRCHDISLKRQAWGSTFSTSNLSEPEARATVELSPVSDRKVNGDCEKEQAQHAVEEMSIVNLLARDQ